ncbi:hypothetical protein M5K25_000870 [Dendrobium thyrsiflorum]|uniref:Uncharacterized protein n=1 Tax=Dendrobium thyrsiflorum TaxID=117978 RepID=A0ABD0VVA8_DENTH
MHPQSNQNAELADIESSTHPSHVGQQPHIPLDALEDLVRPRQNLLGLQQSCRGHRQEQKESKISKIRQARSDGPDLATPAGQIARLLWLGSNPRQLGSRVPTWSDPGHWLVLRSDRQSDLMIRHGYYWVTQAYEAIKLAPRKDNLAGESRFSIFTLMPNILSDHHLRPDVLPDHHLTPNVLPDIHLTIDILPNHRLTSEFCWITN